MNHHGQQQPYGVHGDVTLATHHLLTSIIATRPPFSVVFTDWLSIMAALGVRLLPSDCRTLGRSASWTPSHVPSSVHLRKYLYTVCQGGRSCGSIRHGHPVRSTYTMPLTISRISTVRGRPPGLAGGSKGSKMSHSSSVRSLGYDLRLIRQSIIQVQYFGNTLLERGIGKSSECNGLFTMKRDDGTRRYSHVSAVAIYDPLEDSPYGTLRLHYNPWAERPIDVGVFKGLPPAPRRLRFPQDFPVEPPPGVDPDLYAYARGTGPLTEDLEKLFRSAGIIDAPDSL